MQNNKNFNNELYHYGILGMKWGQRKSEDEANEHVAKVKKIGENIVKRKLETQINKHFKKIHKIDDEINKHADSLAITDSTRKMKSITKKIRKLQKKQNTALYSESGKKAVNTYIQKYGEESLQKLIDDLNRNR